MSYGIKLVDGNSSLDQAKYNELQNQLDQLYKASGGRLTESDFENFLAANNLTDQGFSFKEVPSLSKPSQDFYIEALGTGGLSPGGAIMALITKDAAEQRKMNKDIISQQTEEIVSTIEQQAKEMLAKAITQMVLGIVSGAISIGGGIASLGAGASGLKKGVDASIIGARMSSINSIGGGASGIIGGVSQGVGGIMDASIKGLEAKAEKLRAERDILKEFNNSWSDLIQKTLSASDAIQQSMNQARSKILG